MGHLSRLCLQRKHRPPFLRLDCSLWLARQRSNFARKAAGPAGSNGNGHRVRYPAFQLGVRNGNEVAGNAVSGSPLETTGQPPGKARINQLARYGSSPYHRATPWKGPDKPTGSIWLKPDLQRAERRPRSLTLIPSSGCSII